MLVLLVIFMVTAPLMMEGVTVDLPAADAKPVVDDRSEPFVVRIDRDGAYYLNEDKQPVADLNEIRIKAAIVLRNNPKTPFMVEGDKAVAYDAVVQAMVLLQQAGVPLALVTNKPSRFVPELLADKQLDGYFCWLVGGDTLPVQKPDPAALNWVMQQAGVVASQALFVGDSRSDVLAAKAAGVPVVAVSYGYNHGQPIAAENPDLLVDSLDALI